MSVKALSAVWEDSRATGSDLLVLLALADWADHRGRCYPSYGQLAVKARVSRATAITAIRRLVEMQELQRVSYGHAPDAEDDAPTNVRRQRRNQYQILLVRSQGQVGQSSDHRAREAVLQTDDPPTAEVDQNLDHHVGRGGPDRTAEVVQSTSVGGLNHTAQVVQSADPHIRKNRTEEPSEEPSAATAAAAAPAVLMVVGGVTFDPADPVEAFALAWNATIVRPLKPVHTLTRERRRLVRTRLLERSLDHHVAAMRAIAASSFCAGSNVRGFVATFDWYIGSASPAVKALEGQYDDHFSDGELRAAADALFRVGRSTCEHDPRCEDWRTCGTVRDMAVTLRARRQSA